MAEKISVAIFSGSAEEDEDEELLLEEKVDGSLTVNEFVAKVNRKTIGRAIEEKKDIYPKLLKVSHGTVEGRESLEGKEELGNIQVFSKI
jgi:hypothetical protein